MRIIMFFFNKFIIILSFSLFNKRKKIITNNKEWELALAHQKFMVAQNLSKEENKSVWERIKKHESICIQLSRTLLRDRKKIVKQKNIKINLPEVSAG